MRRSPLSEEVLAGIQASGLQEPLADVAILLSGLRQYAALQMMRRRELCRFIYTKLAKLFNLWEGLLTAVMVKEAV